MYFLNKILFSFYLSNLAENVVVRDNQPIQTACREDGTTGKDIWAKTL